MCLLLLNQPAVSLIETSIIFKQTNVTQAQDATAALSLWSTIVYAEGSFFSGHVKRTEYDAESYLLYTDDSKFVPTLRVPWAKSTSDVYAAHAPWFPSSSLPVNPNALTGAVSHLHARHQPLLSSICRRTSPVLMV